MCFFGLRTNGGCLKMKTTVAAVDFGTSKIEVLVAQTGGDLSHCDIIGAGCAVYNGYMDRQWLVPEEVNDKIRSAIQEAENQSKMHITDINVGVPGSFVTVKTVEVKLELQGTDPQVHEQDINELFSRANQELGETDGDVIHRSPAWFAVDGVKTFDPMGKRGTELRGMISYIIAESYFIEDIRERFRALGINVTSFFSSSVGQAMLFIPAEERDRTAVLVDMGYLCTEVMIVEGDAVTRMSIVPMGGAHIAADVAMGLQITLDSAEMNIKRNYIYGISAGADGFEGKDRDGVTQNFSREEVTAVLQPRADEICEAIRDAIVATGARLTQRSAVYLTGGGMAFNRGSKELLAAKLERPVRDFPRKAARLYSPCYSSATGLVNLILQSKANEHAASGLSAFFHNLFG